MEPEPTAAAALFGGEIEAARTYVRLLATDGVTRGVIGPREPARIWTRHVLNGAAVSELIEQGQRIVDVGTGAGLPGIPLAIARPDCRVDLLEPLDRRVRFLQDVIAALQLENCRVVRARAEQAVDQCGDADVVTSRAVAPLSRLGAWCAPLLRARGVFLAIKGATAAAELERDRAALAAAGLVDPTVLVVVVSGAPATTVVRAVRAPAEPGPARRAVARRPRKVAVPGD